MKLSNPNKELFEGVTKQNVYDYYDSVANKILPLFEGRAVAIVKCPGGVESSCFYNKNIDGGKIYINTKEELLSQIQQNAIEFHVEGYPQMVFDLDPDEGLSHDALVQGCLDLRKILKDLGLTPTIKTSGGKGYHVMVTVDMPFEEFVAFSKNVAELMAAKFPDKYTTNIRKDARKGLVFIDWLRNTKGATCVVAYSLRAKPNAGISMPIPWSKLKTTKPDGVRIRNIAGFEFHKNSPLSKRGGSRLG